MRQMRLSMTTDGGPPYTLTFPEAAGQTFELGAPVVLNASGQVQEAATPAASVCGVAAMPANGAGASRYPPPSTNQPVTVWVANKETIFEVQMTGAIAADVGKLVTVSKTGSLWTADRTTAGTFMVLEIGIDRPGNVPIARGRFLDSATQLFKAA